MNGFVFDIGYYINNAIGGVARYIENQCKILLFKVESFYCEQVIPIALDEVVCTQSLYNYDNLIISEKTDFLKHGGLFIGNRKFFNEAGELDHTENLDEHFPVTWAQLEEILKDKDISLLTVDSIFRYYDEEKDEATWSIIIKLPMEKGCLYVFDARTGELVSEEIIDMQKEL